MHYVVLVLIAMSQKPRCLARFNPSQTKGQLNDAINVDVYFLQFSNSVPQINSSPLVTAIATKKLLRAHFLLHNVAQVNYSQFLNKVIISTGILSN